MANPTINTWVVDSPDNLLAFIQRLRTSSRVILPPSTNEIITVAIYTRKSRVIAGKEEHSLELQADESEAFARRNGFQIYKIYSDPNRTGRNGKRPELQQLIKDIKSARVHAVVVHRLDRLYRNLEGLLNFVRLLIRYDVRLISVTEQIDTRTPWGMLVLQVLGALAEMLVRQTSERVREVKRFRVSELGLPNGNPPLGYCRGNCSECNDPNGPGYCPNHGNQHADIGDGRTLVWHPVDQYAVSLMKSLRRRGHSYREIATILNENAFTLPNGQVVHFRSRGVPGRYPPGPFRADTVRSVLQNVFYTGRVARYERPPLDMGDGGDIPA